MTNRDPASNSDNLRQQIALIIDPSRKEPPYHAPGSCPYCDASNAETMLKVGVIVDLMTEHDRNHYYKLVVSMVDWPQFNDKPWVRVALAIAAKAILRGRHLTDEERLQNLLKAMEDE